MDITDNYKTEVLLDTEHGKRWYRDIRVRTCNDCGSNVAEVFDSIYWFDQDGSKHNCQVKLTATNNLDQTQAVRLSDRGKHE